MKNFSYLLFAFLLVGAGCTVDAPESIDSMMPAPGETDVDEMIVEDMMEEPMMDDDSDADEDAEDIRTINMKTGNFFYDPASITVKAGEEVKLVFETNSGMHDFVIDEIDFKAQVKQGESATFTAPTEPGTYAYYCSVGSHRAMGMEGVLIVE